MSMKKISLITVYNNKKLLDEMLLSVKGQKDVDVDCVMIDNRQKAFGSAAAALNYGAEKAEGDVLVFLHQDIEFLSDAALEQIYDFAVENKNVIFGAAGVKSRKEDTSGKVFTSMYAGENKVKNTSLDKATECFTLDECLIACHRDCMKNIAFDEKTCDGWHLYGADLCLQAGLDSNLRVMVIPMDYVWHKSNGNADRSYHKTQSELARKYKGKYDIINTTNGFQYTNGFKRFVANIYRKLRYNI